MALLSHSTDENKFEIQNFKTIDSYIHIQRYLVKNKPLYNAFGQTNHSIFVLYLILCGMRSY